MASPSSKVTLGAQPNSRRTCSLGHLIAERMYWRVYREQWAILAKASVRKTKTLGAKSIELGRKEAIHKLLSDFRVAV